ncbi:hypothetical protein LJR219_004559 [Phenylobacterium sp. LjRoot219]|uniref:hypothetical protein n=1 Tax=Phenylobacterium sp. LjRoot219 TaxID=3342283 RepID=UPI003ECC2559
MISLENCIGFCGLEEDEVAAVAEHEHVSEIMATEIAFDLLHQAAGAVAVRQMIVEDFRAALARGDRSHAAGLLLTLRRFLHRHPEAKVLAPVDSDHP